MRKVECPHFPQNPASTGSIRYCDIFRRALLGALVAFSVYWLTPYTSSAETQRVQHEAVRNAADQNRPLAYEGLILKIYEGRIRWAEGGTLAYVNPILLVKGGQYVDPDIEADKVGLKLFTEQWLKGKRFAVYGDGGRYGYLENLSLVKKETSSGDRKVLSGQATLIGRNGKHVNLIGYRVVKGTRVVKGRSETRQFVGEPLAIDETRGATAEAMLVPLANPDSPLTAELIQSFISDVKVKKLASEFEHRLLARGGAAEGATVLERREPRLVAHLDIDGNGLPDVIGNFSLLVERNGRTFVFGELIIRYDSGVSEEIRSISDDRDRIDDIVLVSFIRTSIEQRVVDLLVYVSGDRAYSGYAVLTRKTSGWAMMRPR